MKYFLLFIAFVLTWTVLPSAYAQMAPQPQATLSHGSSETWILEWEGISGRTYFLQYSEDLQQWNYFPDIVSGNGTTISYGLASTSDKFFVRLHFTDEATSDPQGDDFDGDGLSNIFEIQYLHTNPFVPNSGAVDSDNDGLADAWEMHWFGSLTAQSGDGDADGDGILNKYEQQANTDPTQDEATAGGDKVFQYGYDSEGRLLSVDGKGASAFTYDNEGNMESAQ